MEHPLNQPLDLKITKDVKHKLWSRGLEEYVVADAFAHPERLESARKIPNKDLGERWELVFWVSKRKSMKVVVNIIGNEAYVKSTSIGGKEFTPAPKKDVVV